MTGYVKFRRPIILKGLLEIYRDPIKPNLSYFEKNGGEAIEYNKLKLNLDMPSCPRHIGGSFLYYKEKYDNGEGNIAFRVDYKGFDVLVHDSDGDHEEIPNFIPESLFEI